MNLLNIIDSIDDNKLTDKNILKRIKFLRIFLSVHSYLYYHVGESIISDNEWDKKAKELVDLQKQYGYNLSMRYDEEFKDFDGSTGMHLPKNEYIIFKSLQLLRTHYVINELYKAM